MEMSDLPPDFGQFPSRAHALRRHSRSSYEKLASSHRPQGRLDRAEHDGFNDWGWGKNSCGVF
jgi:hypothetical protein